MSCLTGTPSSLLGI